MTSQEWKIHKRLLDAGGKGDSVYICCGRGSGKSETERRLIEELQANGKTIIPLRLKDLQNGRTMSSSVLDYDLLEKDRSERAEHWLKTLYDAMEQLKSNRIPRYTPEYEFLTDWYALDEYGPISDVERWVRRHPDYVYRYVRGESR